MTLYTKQVIINPINLWLEGRDYFVGNTVENDSVFYVCTLDNTASLANEPPGIPWTDFVPIDPNVDISNFVETIHDTEIGSGDVRSSTLRINADRGAFITDRNDGLTPIIDEFTKITTKITDPNGVLYLATHEVITVHPTADGIQGTVLPVDLLGSEFYLQKTLFSDQFFFKSMFDVTSGIVNFYNTNKGFFQARIAGADADSSNGGFNDLPVWTANDYTFNLNEITHYDGLIHVMDRGGSSVAAGGAGDFFEIAFSTNPTNAEEINFRGFSSGFPTDQTSIPNIKSDSIIINPAEQIGEIDATIGNVVGTWTDNSIGTLPRQNADFIGALEAWQLFPAYVTGGVLYPEDAIILVINSAPDSQGDDFHYKANKDTTITPPVPPTLTKDDWDNYTFTEFLQNEVNYNFASYSFWTDIKSELWRSNGAKTAGTLQDDPPTTDSVSVWDSNQVKIDGVFRETWADVRANNSAAISDVFKRNGQVYRGFRVLVDGVGSADFTDFDNKIIQWDGVQWLIFLNPEDELLVGVDAEAKTFQFDGVAWSDITGSLEQSNDVYHPVFDIYNSQGHNDKQNGISLTITNIVGDGGNNVVVTVASTTGLNTEMAVAIEGTTNYNKKSAFITALTPTQFIYKNTIPTSTIPETSGLVKTNFGQNSAVTYEFRMTLSDSIIGFGNPTFYRQFVGANFRAPFPFNSLNGNTIGLVYGNNDDRLPATFEAENMGLTSSGFSGFNNDEAEDLGPFDGLIFFAKHEWRYDIDGSGNIVFWAGNFAYRCALYDIDDTVVTQDFVIPFNNLWASISLPISQFKTYKARTAWAFGNISQNIFLQELEILNSFRWRNIKKIAIHWLGPYDDQGRFNPNGQILELYPSIIDLGTLQPVSGYNVKFSIDSFQWSHPGLSISEPNQTRPLQPEFFYEPLITNKFQNDQANLAKLEITKFRHKEFEVTTVGFNDLRYGDSFFLENRKLVNDADRTTDDLDDWVTATQYTANNNDVQDLSVGYRCIQNHTSSGANQPPDTEFWQVLANPIPNTIKLVAKKIERLIDKRPDGPGGFLRTITGIRRFKEGEQ